MEEISDIEKEVNDFEANHSDFLKFKRCKVSPKLMRKLSISTIPIVYHIEIYIKVNLMVFVRYFRC